MVIIFLLITIALSGCFPYRDPATTRSRRQKTSYQVLTPKYKRGDHYYIVQKGDSLWRISRRFGVTVERLMEDNKISSTRNLKVGERILIPAQSLTKSDVVFIWPVQGEILSLYGEKMNNVANRGLNIKAKDINVKASAGGNVIFADYLKGWGQTLILKHRNNFYTVYSNLADILVKRGTAVGRGEPIGKLQLRRGKVEGVLHFEIRKNYFPQNPLNYLR